ncbi:MAG: sensor histidine kinase [Pirellulales bacterium]|nr:sensor histidine kinase [Pirellulales bacterium]
MANVGTSDNSIPADSKRRPARLRHARDELEHSLRALSHDMAANFMLLDNSFRRLKASLAAGDPGEVQPLVAHVEACLRESKRFLDDMAMLARSGTLSMEPCCVEVGEIVEEVLFEQRELLVERRVEVDVRPLRAVWCNRHRLKQVLTNLIRNAVKHGCDPQQPRITISAEFRRNRITPPNSPLVAIRVHDNGPGIDPRHHEEIFLPGRRLLSSSEEGVGMGLAIVRKIAEHFGGSATVEASCRNGTAFLVALPAPPEPARHQGPGRFPTETSELRRIEHDTPHEEQRPHRRAEKPRSKPARHR